MHKDLHRKMDVHDPCHNNTSDNTTRLSTTERGKLVGNDDSNSETTNDFKNVFESTLFTGNNIYFLVFASLAMLITTIVTIIRHRQQKFAAEQKELEYLRYFHSILPHSQIYGNLNEKFMKLDKRKNSKKRKNSLKLKRKRTDKVVDMSDADIKLNGLTSIYKRFRYSQYTSRTLSKDSGNNDDSKSFEETEMINVELNSDAKVFENGQVATITADTNVAHTGNICQKYQFDVKTDNMQDNTVYAEETDNAQTLTAADTQDTSNEKVVQKSKTDSSTHRVHFSLDCDDKNQETATENESQIQHVAQININISDSDKAGLKKLLMENMDNMQVTAL